MTCLQLIRINSDKGCFFCFFLNHHCFLVLFFSLVVFSVSVCLFHLDFTVFHISSTGLTRNLCCRDNPKQHVCKPSWNLWKNLYRSAGSVQGQHTNTHTHTFLEPSAAVYQSSVLQVWQQLHLHLKLSALTHQTIWWRGKNRWRRNGRKITSSESMLKVSIASVG